MRSIPKFSVGDPISAAKMNSLVDFAGTPNAGVPGSGSSIFGSQTANGDMQFQSRTPILVFATEDFAIRTTDHAVPDDCPSGLCNFVDLVRSVNMYAKQTEGRPFYIHDPIAALSGGDSMLFNDVFYAVWNKDSKRWEVMAGANVNGNSGGAGCGCTCIVSGDIIVNDIITSSQWGITMQAVAFEQDNGTILFPSGEYIVVYDSMSGVWTLDIGDRLTAIYNDETDATADSTLDGTLTMAWTAGTAATVTLCVDGVIPDPSTLAPPAL